MQGENRLYAHGGMLTVTAWHLVSYSVYFGIKNSKGRLRLFSKGEKIGR